MSDSKIQINNFCNRNIIEKIKILQNYILSLENHINNIDKLIDNNSSEAFELYLLRDRKYFKQKLNIRLIELKTLKSSLTIC